MRSLKSLFTLVALPACALAGAAWAQDKSATAIPVAAAAPAPNIVQAQEDQAYAIGTLATVYLYPLVISGATAESLTAVDKPMPNGLAPFNQIGHVSRLMTAANREVVSPNADTVYSSAFLDLKQGAALISVPASGKRYYSLMLEDAYTNIFGYIGSRATGTEAGSYLIAGPGWKGSVPPGARRIDSPTPFVWVIGRTLVDGEKDLPAVAAFQQQVKLEIVPPAIDATPIKQRWSLGAPVTRSPVRQVDALDWKTYFTWAGKLLKDNPPPADEKALVAQFADAGLSVERGFEPDKLTPAALKGLERAYAAGTQIFRAEAQKTGGTELNGWGVNMSAGRWGLDYKLRAAIAWRTLGQNTPEEAVYLNTRKDGKGEPLTGARRYVITFPAGQLPPAKAFWSISIYDRTNFFAENPINRYAIGNRTEGMRFNPDGSLTIVVQKDAPEEAMRNNWLPAPADEFRLSLRLYVPEDRMLQLQWTPPAPVARGE